jgi:hypothetical protein
MVFRQITLLAALVIIVFSPQESQAQGKPEFSNYEYYVTDDGAFGLYRPKGWKVGTQRFPNGRMVFVTDQKGLSYVSLLFQESIDPGFDSARFASATLKNVIQQVPDLKILEARSSQDRMHTVVKYQRTAPQKVLIEGRYTFNVKRPTALVTGYEAPAKDFRERVSTLLTVVANITVLDDQAYHKLLSQRKDQGPMMLPMREVSAQDNTCRLMIPDGWNLIAAKGAAACASPDENAGYIFTTQGFVARSRIPHFDSSKIPGLHYEYMRPVDALIVAARHMGSSNHRVLERYSNSSWAMEASVFLRKQMDAEIALISYTNRKGGPCIGYYDVLGSPPDNAGQWGIMPMGFWAPESQFARYLPSLIKIAESFRINEQWAKEYVRQGMAKVREMMGKTSSMMSRYAEEMRQSNLAGHQNRMRSGDFTSYKFSTYMRGEQEWVGSLEGGTVIKTDHWGLSVGGKTVIEGPPFNYYNFQGEKYGLIPVDISREVFEAVKGVP